MAAAACACNPPAGVACRCGWCGGEQHAGLGV
jgi:hypothetical protein